MIQEFGVLLYVISIRFYIIISDMLQSDMVIFIKIHKK